MAPPFPNPVNGVSVISFRLQNDAQVDVNIYDVSGALVRKLLPRQALEAGPHTLRWDLRDEAGSDVAAGVYFVRGHADGAVVGRKVIVVP
jgi:flagellar hook assembly protein FlgD